MTRHIYMSILSVLLVLLCVHLFQVRDGLVVLGSQRKNHVVLDPPSRVTTKATGTISSSIKPPSFNDNIQQQSLLEQVVADVEQNRPSKELDSMLDIAIIGFAKTSSTSHKKMLHDHPQIAMVQKEDYHVRKPQGNLTEFVQILYQMKHKGGGGGNQANRLVGYKDPEGIHSLSGLSKLQRFWPSCRLVIGLRHPVSWFESFYNFWVFIKGPDSLPPAEELSQGCLPDVGLCVERTRFHDYMAMLGKTNLSDPNELQLLSPSIRSKIGLVKPMSNPVFVYELGQYADPNATRKQEYLGDLANFLGLTEPLYDHVNDTNTRTRKQPLNICQDRYQQLRDELMQVARPASRWIRRYFLKSQDVVVSSPAYMDELLARWEHDPCETN